MPALAPFRLVPAYHPRVWGGRRLGEGPVPIGEAWVVYEQNRVADGPAAGLTLAALSQRHGPDLLGRAPLARSGLRFPLLIKLIDTADWLSLQVHPDDAQALRLEGPGHLGKTEAWHILAAEPGASLICGVRPGTTAEALTRAVRDGHVLELVHTVPVQPGDTVLLRAGTLHALGPGLFVYEVQQTSNLTYRVFDWNRPQSGGRVLHLEQSLQVVNPEAGGEWTGAPPIGEVPVHLPVAACEYFVLELLAGEGACFELDTGGESFHALTVAAGTVLLEGEGWVRRLGSLESLVVPASAGAYRARAEGAARLLKASVP